MVIYVLIYDPIGLTKVFKRSSLRKLQTGSPDLFPKSLCRTNDNTVPLMGRVTVVTDRTFWGDSNPLLLVRSAHAKCCKTLLPR